MSHSPSTPLSGRLLGIGRRTTMPVQPIAASGNQPHKQHSPSAATITAISSTQYKPPPTLSTATRNPPGAVSPASHPSPRSSLHVKSLTMDNPPSPYQPEPSVLSSASPRGGRLNELLNLGRSRAVSADSYAAASHVSSHSSDSSGGSSTASTPEEIDAACDRRVDAASAVGVQRQLIRAGQLRKRSPRGLQLWQSRYCWLYSDQLQYSKTRDSRAMQGSIPLAAIRHVQTAKAAAAVVQAGSAGEKLKRRFDVLISAASDDKSSDGRMFHFEASTERETDEWVIALTQACRAAASSGSRTHSRRATGEGDKFWKTSASRLSDGLPPQHPSLSVPSRVSLTNVPRPSSAERRRTDGAAVVQQATSRLGQPSSYMPSSLSASHRSMNSYSPSSMSTASSAAGPVSPIQAPTVHGELPPSLLAARSGSESPVSSYSIASSNPSLLPSAGSLASFRSIDDRSSPLPPPTPTVPAMLSVVQRVDFHPIGDWFLCRDKATTTDSSWYLMHATHHTDPLFSAIRQATVNAATFNDSRRPYRLHRLAVFSSADAVFALYTPAFRPSDTLMSYLHSHRRLPEPVVRYVAVHVIRALLSLHATSQSYPLLSPASLAFDGEAAICFIDPMPSLTTQPQLPEYQLHSGEHEGSRADWWRLGVLLYELAVGFPPVRAESDQCDEWTGVARQLERFHPMTLPFPPFVPAALQSLIRQLLMAEMSDRLGCGELADDEVTQHPYFDGVPFTADMDDCHAPPPWVRQHVLKQPVRLSLTARNAAGASQSDGSSGVSSTASTPLHVTRPHASSAFTFSPLSSPPHTERKLFFPANMAVGGPSSIDAYMQQLKPPRNLLRLPSASSLSSSPSASTTRQRPSALHLTLLGGRGFPQPKDDTITSAASSLQRIKRRTLGDKSFAALKDAAADQQGVYVAVECEGEEAGEEMTSGETRVRVSRLVVGPAACQPSFGDAFYFTLPSDEQRFDSVELSLKIRHTRIGAPLTADGGAVDQLVGSVSVPVRSLQSAVTASDEIWHSVISSAGLVVGEVHVRYEFTYELMVETVQRQWWLAAEVQQDGTFESLFGVQLTEAAQVETEVNASGETSRHQLSVVVEASEDASRQHSVCLPTGNEPQLLLDARALNDNNTDSHGGNAVSLNSSELFEPQERTALANVVSGASATLLSTRPTAVDVQLLRSVLCDSKLRTAHNGISVDLSPITERLIAFASPVTLSALTAYRSPLSHIQLYLQAAYPAVDTLSSDSQSAIRIYNLNTDSSIALIPALGTSSLSFAPHSVPPFDALLWWCADVQTWLGSGEGRAVAVHCLSGVWRCCVAVCAYLLFDGQATTVADAVSLFCRQRLTAAAAASFVLLPSHRRWLQYMEQRAAKLRRASFSSRHPAPHLSLVHRSLHLTHVRLTGLSSSITNPLWGGHHDHVLWHIIVHSTAGVVVYDSRVLGTTAARRERGGSVGGRDVVTSGCEVSGEWRLSVCCESEVRVSCWLHTYFVGDERYVKLRRDELDWPAGSYRGARAGSTSAVEDVSVECFFTSA